MLNFLEIPIFSLLVNTEQLESVKMMADLTDLIILHKIGKSARIRLRTKTPNEWHDLEILLGHLIAEVQLLYRIQRWPINSMFRF